MTQCSRTGFRDSLKQSQNAIAGNDERHQIGKLINVTRRPCFTDWQPGNVFGIGESRGNLILGGSQAAVQGVLQRRADFGSCTKGEVERRATRYSDVVRNGRQPQFQDGVHSELPLEPVSIEALADTGSVYLIIPQHKRGRI